MPLFRCSVSAALSIETDYFYLVYDNYTSFSLHKSKQFICKFRHHRAYVNDFSMTFL